VVDVVEEVARIIGYDKIPMTMLGEPLPRQNPEPIINLKRQIRLLFSGYGFQEVINYSLTSREMLDRLLSESHTLEPAPLRIANPMTADQEYLRPNLRANLLAALASNRRYEEGGIRLFELGRVYLPNPKGLPHESEFLCGVLSGLRFDEWWQGDSGLVDFFDDKGIVEALLSHLDVEASFEVGKDKSLHPNKQASIVIAGDRLGVVGELHPKVLSAFDILENACLFEINVTALSAFTVGHRLFQPIPRFPATVRDIALVVNTEVTHQQVQDIIKGSPLVSQVTIFDVYSGEQVPPGKKSLAYRITYQSPSHTLTEKEVNKVQQQILDKLARELEASLRT
jgi:phenylalanyl-tRNA synthetase beta chain